jgi:hypothetical protein
MMEPCDRPPPGSFWLRFVAPNPAIWKSNCHGTVPEKVFIRYRLDNDDLGGWVQPRSGVSSYWISTMLQGRPATRIRALLYAPGCAIQTLDLPLSGSNNQKYWLTCRPLPNISIAGVLTRKELLAGREFNLEARYVARAFDPQLITTVPIGDDVSVSTDGRFKLEIPDFSQDSPAEIQIWAREKASGKLIAQLLPAVRTQSDYPVHRASQSSARRIRIHAAAQGRH